MSTTSADKAKAGSAKPIPATRTKKPPIVLSPALQALAADPDRLKAIAQQARDKLRYRRLETFRPYPRQAEFFNATKDNSTVALIASNRFGKSLSAAVLISILATGIYPDWYTGRRFDTPVKIWCVGVNNEMCRDVQQAELIGPPTRDDEWGTGLIPRELLGSHVFMRGVAAALDTINVRHSSGGWSTIGFKSMLAGREKFQGTAQHAIWIDEECPEDIFTECQTRTMTVDGITTLTFTPLQGFTPLVSRFLGENPPGAVIRATIDDALHFTPEQRVRMVANMLPHERAARARGEPALGSGVIFPVNEADISFEAFAMPSHWPSVGAIDFGIDHPTAAVKMSWDRESDCVYVTHLHRAKDMTPIQHSETLKAWGAGLPFCWPTDGLIRDKTSGQTLAEAYRLHGINMLPERVTFEDGGVGVEAGLQLMLERFQTGRLKIAQHLKEIFEEIRRYHRKNGQVVKVEDDAICAVRYALMGLRFAETNIGRKLMPIRRGIRVI